MLTALFSKPKVPKLTVAPPPQPPKNPQLDAEMAQMGRQQGLLAALFGPQGGTKSTTTGSSPGGGHQLTGR